MDPNQWHCIPPDTTNLIPWQPAPNFRSTINILTSCFATLFLCIWSALHVDIQKGRSTLGRYLSKFGWLLVALLGPEFVFLIASNQFREALRITLEGQVLLPVTDSRVTPPCRNMRRLAWVLGIRLQHSGSEPSEGCPALSRVPESPHGVPALSRIPVSLEGLPASSPVTEPPEGAPLLSQIHESLRGPAKLPGAPETLKDSIKPATRTHRWTLAHGYYAAMGGFVLKDPHVPRLDDRYLPAWQKSGVLTPNGVLFLMRHAPSLIPDLAADDILDRSKADGLAKTLLVWQVMWFVLTCINRSVQGLPLALLEIATIAHALCSLLTYALWWHKPKDVDHPTAIAGPGARPIGAMMSILSPARRYVLAGLISVGREHEASKLELHKHTSTSASGPGVLLENYGSVQGSWTLMTRFVYGRTTVPWYYGGLESPEERRATELRWSLASRAFQQYPSELHDPAPREQLVIPRASLQAFALDASQSADPVLFLIRSFVITLLLGAFYGLPHLIGFTVRFASAAERTLWLMGTVVVATMGVAFVAGMVLTSLFLRLWLLVRDSYPPVWLSYWWAVTFLVGAIVYVASSGCLIIESIRQLFALPPAAFDLPSWGRYWPHFS